MKYTLLLLFVGLSVLSWAQSKDHAELERLKKTIRQSTLYDSAAVFENGKKAIALARKLKNGVEEGLIQQYYGNFYYYSNNTEKAKSYYAKAIRIAQKEKSIQLENATEIRLAFILSESDVLKGEEAFLKLLNTAQQNKLIENAIECYNGLGILAEKRVMNDKAVEYYLKGLRLAEKHKKKYFIAFLLNNLGLLKHELKQYEDSKTDLTRGLKLAKEVEEYRLISNLQNNLGLVNRELGDYKAAIVHYHATVKMTKSLGFPFGIGAAYINLGNSYQYDKQYSPALLYADSAIALFHDFYSNEYLGVAFLLKGSIAADLGNFNLAATCVNAVESLLKEQHSNDNVIGLYELKAKIAEKTGDFKHAFEWRNRFYELRDSLQEITNQDKLTDLQVLYGKERIEGQLAEAKNRNTLIRKEGELKSAYWRLITLIIFITAVLITGIVYFRYLANMRKQQKEFSQRLIANIDEERSRISKDLHDDIGQLLSVVKTKINMFHTGRLESIAGLEQEVGEVINQTRGISHQLHPSSLEKIGLERSLVSLLEKTQNATGLICSLEVDSFVKLWPIEIQTQLYRIFQECINNTIKHAEAQALRIVIREEARNVIAKYRDNGKGMDTSQLKRGLGWLTIQERIHKIAGKMEVSSAPNLGMKLQFKFKLP